MSEALFSYRPILQELTEVVISDGLDPYEAYQWLYESQQKLGLQPESYLSTSITSGGHARDEGLEMKEIIARNCESARLLAEQLYIDKQIEATTAIEPAFVGKTHWNQAEFMEFWLTVIGGYQFNKRYVARDVSKLRENAREMFSRNEIDIDKMTSKESAESRALEYFKMSSAFAELIKQGADAQPIQKLVRMIDTDMSLGAQTERAFARQIGVKVMNISIVKPAQPEDLGIVNHVLARDTARLIQFGATIFDTEHNQARLLLTESHTP